MGNILLLERMAHFYFGVFGELVFPDGQIFATVEKPWIYNRKDQSCIPEGTYDLRMRTSPVVNRSSGREFQKGWHITGVPNRGFIMMHPANWPSDLLGCVGVGTYLTTMNDPQSKSYLGVAKSRDAFRRFMALMEERETWELDIRTRGSVLM